MKEFFVLDRKEGEFYILEDKIGRLIRVNSLLVVNSIKEGDILIKIDDRYYFDKAQSIKRKKTISRLTEGLWLEDE